MKKFALIGAAGYVAPRHMKAIKETGNELIACLDPNDSIGIIDSYFPDASFFTEFEIFDRHLDKNRRDGKNTDFISICSPNYLHDSHIRFALRSESDVICEKPLVLNPWNIQALERLEKDTGRKVNTILQLRLHPSVIKLKESLNNNKPTRKFDVDLTYITSRGRWYDYSWKGKQEKSGGIATNIGVHFFDLLHYLFGDLQDSKLHLSDNHTAAGFLEFEQARVRWFLSIKKENLPAKVKLSGKTTFRSILIDGEEFEFSGGFEDLHTRSYTEIVNGNGFGLEDNKVAIETVAAIRTMKLSPNTGDAHPIVAGMTV